MTLKQTAQKINSLQHLIGQNAPKWNSPILDIVPAPANRSFTKFIERYKQTGNYEKAMQKISCNQFDVLLIFRTPRLHKSLICEWYGFFYSEHGTSDTTHQYSFKENTSPLLVA
jgi:hypothetical protein